MSRDEDELLSGKPRRQPVRDDDDDEDRPRKKRSRDDEDDEKEEVERPRKKSPSADDDVKSPKPMPTALVGAIIAAMAWGILSLNSTCLYSASGIVLEIENQRMQREQEENFRKLREQMRAAGLNQKIGDGPEFGAGGGLRYTLLGTRILLMLMATLLLAGGIVLLMRKSFGKFIAMGAPVGMLLVDLSGFVICLIITKGTLLAHHNVDYLVNLFLSLVVGGTIVFLLMNKEVGKALK